MSFPTLSPRTRSRSNRPAVYLVPSIKAQVEAEAKAKAARDLDETVERLIRELKAMGYV